ncbi:acyltransferase family protein [Salinicola sp. JS01]|uniref:acyltransferase family protein n=1 Tax=Salinicola sp. JS01 TaxID=3050071 RepID=UPI00255B8F63|nr:acyltransferase family protein [Salinicola sp. JS01]WIX34583.1 acyltransferase family protein [Salinicola sp. JS01]
MARHSSYLYEIQGLRAVAALMVAVYHIWIQKVSGGVDVFFVVAAFFIVGSLTRGGPPTLGGLFDYYAKTLRRVVPSAAVVIVTTVALSLWLMPDSMWRNQIKHALASTLFLENWALAFTATDYLQQGSPPSPFQQLWALAVQVQFYCLFPLLLWVAGRVGRDQHGYRRRVIVALVLIGLLSLGYSVYMTARNQPWAYFDSGARAWEFAIGGLLAFAVTRMTLSRLAAKLLGWVSLAVLLTFALFLEVSSSFPGVVALIPVLAACGIIVAARNQCDIWLLNNRGVVWFGDLSFAFYLWHWPLLSCYRYATGGFDVGLLPGLAIIGGAALLAGLTTWGFENPVRRSAWLSRHRFATYAACAALLALPMAALGGWYHDYQGRRASAEAALDRFLHHARPAEAAVYPPTLIASMDLPPSSRDGCHQSATDAELVECSYGDPDADKTVVLAGGSHAQQWLAALQRVAARERFRLVTLTKGGCMLSLDADADYMAYPSCHAWNERVIARIRQIQPDYVFTNSTRGQGSAEYVPEGYLAAWNALAEGGVRVLALRDNPWFGFDVPECVDLHEEAADACAKPRDALLSRRSPTADYHLDNVYFADISDLFCDERLCRPLQGKVLLYRDDHHITNTFSQLAAPRIAHTLAQAEAAFAMADAGHWIAGASQGSQPAEPKEGS